VCELSDRQPSLHVLGPLSASQVATEMRSARALVFPSEWYEGFPVTIAEAFAHGLPVIASRLGAMAELVEEGRTGLLFRPGDVDDLERALAWAASHPEDSERMGENARRVYERRYTPQRNFDMLMDIYQRALTSRRRAR
jgi:glycosyltransferase involved in cell wall biosynthesis